MIVINGIEIKEKKVAYDGCHKLYVVRNNEKEMKGYGYEIHPIEEIAGLYANSCPLRFIEYSDDCERIVPQFTKEVVFESDLKRVKVVNEDN